MSDAEAVLAANDAFYRAFESLEIDRMRAVWLNGPTISCIHPGWGALVGWPAVMDSWEQIFSGTLHMQFTLSEVSVTVHGDVAWVVCIEGIDSRQVDGRAQARVQATNVFQRHDGRWALVHHHGGPLFDRRPDRPDPTTLQ
jgi:ketosteroid isomerase-like protein